MVCRLTILVFCLAVAVVSAEVQAEESASKIVKESTVDISAVPYQVSIQLNNWHSCGGALTDPSWVLTAAHCVRKGTAANYTVRAGSNRHYSGGVMAQVSKIIIHPLFDENNSNHYDVALLQLETPLQSNDNIKPIPLSDSQPKEEDKLLVSGWGNVRGVSQYSDNLQSETVLVYSKDKCKTFYTYFLTASDSMICAGYIEDVGNSFKGDTGGPAVLDSKLAGIVSWGDGCARKNAPRVYTTVASVKPWVESQVS